MRKIILLLVVMIFGISSKSTSHEVIATYYNPVKEQCDDDPLTTADGSKIDLEVLKRGGLKWIAVSRDLLKYYKYGDIIYIESDNKKLSGYWIVRDTMNERYTNRIDILTHDKWLLDKPTKVRIRKIEW